MRKAPWIASGGAALIGLALLFNPSVRAGGGFKVEPIKPVDPKPQLGLISDADKKLPQDNDYIVHEWGTFTSFSGSDGIALDFRPLVDEDLPKFVMDRPRQSALNDRRELAYARGVGEKGIIVSKQRMETPVTYFYTDKERIIDASVEFPQGLLTEFFPPVRQFGPAYKKDARESLEKSWLRWGKIRLLPEAKALNKDGVDPFIRQIDAKENPHYGYARETDSAHLQITDPTNGNTYREKFLFYRGVGNFKLPVRVQASGSDHFTLDYSGNVPLQFAFLVQIEHGAIRFARYDQIAQPTQMTLPSQASSMKELSDEMVRALVSNGLFDKEAQAMVKTWKSSWFGEEGTRVLYSLPQGDTDRLLPLHLAPAPRETIRVMVGRLETLTPEQEASIAALVSHLGDNDPSARMQAARRIRELGRFAEPALTRVAATSDDPEVKLSAQALLRTILEKKGIPAERQ